MAQKTKIEKAGAIFKTAADKTKKLRKKINLDEKELLNVLKENFELLIKNIEQTGKIAGVTLLWLSEYFVRVFNGLFISNALLRKTEKGFANIKPKKISAKDNILEKMGASITKALQESPTKYAYISYYASLILLLGAAAMTDVARGEDSYIRGKFKEKDKKEIKKDEEEPQEEQDNKGQEISNEEGAPIYDIFKTDTTNVKETEFINPNLEKAEFVKQAIDEYWPEIALGLTELETYRATPVRQGSEKRSTNGLGCTYTYYYNKNGVLYRTDNPINAKKVRIFDKNGNYEQCKRHVIYEVLPFLQSAIKGKNNIDARQSIALALAGYQRPGDMKGMAADISDATTEQQLADAFTFYNGGKGYKEGTLKRRWWCAALAIGVIDIDDFLGLKRDAFSRVSINNIYRNGHFLFDEATVKYAFARAKGTITNKTDSVSGFLNSFETGKAILGSVKVKRCMKRVFFAQAQGLEQDFTFKKSMELLNSADALFAEKKYLEAEKLYLQAIDENADNMEAYSSLALTYKKLGDENKSLSYYDMCVQTVERGNEHMNSNKSLLMDRAIKAASYYNAGLAREGMAEIYIENGDIKSAKEHYEMAIKNYQTAMDNADKEDLSESVKNVYQNAKKRAEEKKNKLKGKKIAFEAGIKEIKKKTIYANAFVYDERDLT